MIRLVEPSTVAETRGFGNPVLTAQIQAMAAVTAGGVRRDFWVQTDESRLPGSLVCRSGSTVWGTARSGAALEETLQLLKMLEAETWQLDDTLATPLGWCSTSYPVLIQPQPQDGKPHSRLKIHVFTPGTSDWVRPLLELLAEAGELPRGPLWDTQYSELHLRARRNAAAGVVCCEAGAVVAAAALGAIGTTAAEVSHVCTLESKRGLGYGSVAVGAACSLARQLNRTPVLCCGEERMPFYTRLGFFANGECLNIVT